MFTKLLKYDMRSLKKTGVPILISLLAFTVLATVIGYFLMGYLDSSFNSTTTTDLQGILTTFASLFFFLGLMLSIVLFSVASTVMLVLVCVHFYKNTVSDEGYLTFTLPVKTSEIIFSKLLSGFTWTSVITIASVIGMVVVFFGSMLPALIAGRSLVSCLSIYADQTQNYGYLFHNAPTIWRFFEGADFESFSVVSVFCAGAAVILFIYFCLTFLKKLEDRDLIKIFFLSAMLIPYLLPRMHERYFYMADILALVYFMYDRRKWYIPVTLILSSVIGYLFYFTEIVIIEQKYIAVLFLIILATETRELFKEFWHKTPDKIELS